MMVALRDLRIGVDASIHRGLKHYTFSGTLRHPKHSKHCGLMLNSFWRDTERVTHSELKIREVLYEEPNTRLA